jgi:hypothetical protein
MMGIIDAKKKVEGPAMRFTKRKHVTRSLMTNPLFTNVSDVQLIEMLVYRCRYRYTNEEWIKTSNEIFSK